VWIAKSPQRGAIVERNIYNRIQRVIMKEKMVSGIIDAGIDNLSKTEPIPQTIFIGMLLERAGSMFTNQMFRNWNYYKINILRYSNECSYTGFRRAVWKMKNDGLLSGVREPKPAAMSKEKYELFGKTHYSATPKLKKMVQLWRTNA
jgi:hypothetical protein